MPKLSDTQLILLTAANQREDGGLLPAPDSIGDAGARLKTSLAALLKRSLASEQEVTMPNQVWREDGDHRFGLVITDAGRAVLESGVPAADVPPELAGDEDKPATSKKAKVIELLKRPEGATLDELVQATGWLPHTTRAALTGIRKAGLTVDKSQRGEATCYRIAAGA